MPEAPLDAPRWATLAVLCAACYYAAARIQLSLALPGDAFALLNPTPAVLLVALLGTPRERWWVLLIAAAAAHLAAHAGAPSGPGVAAQAAWSVAFALAAASLIRARVRAPHPFGTTRDLGVYLLAAAVLLPAAAAAVAPATLTSLAQGKFALAPPAWRAWATVFFAGVTNLIVLAPAMVLWMLNGTRWLRTAARTRYAEAVTLAAAAAAVCMIGFSSNGPSPVLYASLVPLLWAAVRFGSAGVASVHFVMALLATATLLADPAATLLPVRLVDDVMHAQLALIALALPMLILAVAMDERSAASAALNAATEALADRDAQLGVALEARRAADRALEEAVTRLSHGNRLAVAGQLTASIAHELNQPLSAISMNADTAMLLLESPAPQLDLLEEIVTDTRDNALRASAVVGRLRELLQHRKLERQPLDLNEVVRSALQLLRGEAVRRGIRLEAALDTIPAVRGDRIQLQQVLLNLILNGMESMLDTPDGRRSILVSTRTADAATVEASVADTGSGLAPEVLARLYDPFYTTKPDGMGLGLPLVRLIVAAHGGRVRAENNALRGATFTVELPVVPPASDARESARLPARQ